MKINTSNGVLFAYRYPWRGNVYQLLKGLHCMQRKGRQVSMEIRCPPLVSICTPSINKLSAQYLMPLFWQQTIEAQGRRFSTQRARKAIKSGDS